MPSPSIHDHKIMQAHTGCDIPLYF